MHTVNLISLNKVIKEQEHVFLKLISTIKLFLCVKGGHGVRARQRSMGRDAKGGLVSLRWEAGEGAAAQVSVHLPLSVGGGEGAVSVARARGT